MGTGLLPVISSLSNGVGLSFCTVYGYMNSSINQFSETKPSVLMVIGTGGTIAGRSTCAGDNVGYTAGQMNAAELLEPVMRVLPASVRSLEIVVEQLTQLDSKDMDEATWVLLARRVNQLVMDESVAGVVITHGTDTIEETGYWLHRAVNATKPVVLTCAMRPATALNADGPQNLVDALTVASQSRHAAGVWVVAAGVIHHPQFVSKVHPYRVDAFESVLAGPAGWIEEGQARWTLNLSELRPVAGYDARCVDVGRWPRVEVLFSHGGASVSMLQAVLNAPGDVPLRGLVVAGTGNGTIHRDWLLLLEQAQAGGLLIWRTTRCLAGCVVPAANATEFIPSVGLPPFKARIEMALHLMQQDQELLGHEKSPVAGA
jgi:L-asparaginase